MAVWALTASIVLVAFFIPGCRGQCESSSRPKLVNLRSNTEEVITSPGYPDTTYPHNSECAWQIRVTSYNHVIHLHVDVLELDSTYYNCRSDYIDLYDGDYSQEEPGRQTPVLARLCSAQYGRDFYSTTRNMYVLFVSDTFDTARGFSLRIGAVPPRLLSTTAALPTLNTTTTSTVDDSFSQSLEIARIVGICIGALIALIIIIVVPILVLRRCLRPCLVDEDPVHRTIPNALPLEDTLISEGRPPRNRPPYNAEPVLTNHQVLPGTPRINGRRDVRSSDGSDIPWSGSQLEVPGQNGRSGSPGPGGRGGSPGGSPRSRSSPRGGGRPRSPGGRFRPGPDAPPIPPPDTSGPAFMDAPPTYDEVMAASPQPSAPPLD